MSYSVIYDDINDYIIVSVVGKLNHSLLENIAKDAAAEIKKHNCDRILTDLRFAKLSASPTNVYKMPKIAKEAGIHVNIKRALLVRVNDKEFDFLETVFINQGNLVRMFDNLNDAKKWLL